MNRRIYVLALGAFAFGTDVFVVAGVLPVIAHDKGVSINAASLLITAFSLAFGFGAPFLAVLTNQISRQKLLPGVLLGFCLANLLSALAPTFLFLLAMRVLAACCAALYMPNASVVVSILAPAEKRGKALGTVLGGFTLATVLGVPIGTWIGVHIGWQATFLFVVIITLVAFLALAIPGLPRVVMPSSPSLRARFGPLTNPRMLLALFPAFWWTAASYTIYTFIALVLRQNTHITDPSSLLLVYGAGLVAGNWLGGRAADRFGVTRPIAAGLVVLILVSIALPFTTTTLIGAAVTLGIWGAAGFTMAAPQQHRLLSLSAGLPAVILALSSSVAYLGIAAGSGVGSLVLTLTQGSITPLCLTGAAFAALALSTYGLSTRLSPIRAVEKRGVAPSRVPATERLS